MTDIPKPPGRKLRICPGLQVPGKNKSVREFFRSKWIWLVAWVSSQTRLGCPWWILAANIALALLCCPLCLQSQVGNVTLVGSVRRSNESGIPGATITVRKVATDQIFGTTT